MTDQKNTHNTNVVEHSEAVSGVESVAPDRAIGIPSAASFASAESREILNLLGDAEGGSCCGGGCCSVE